MSTEVKVVLKKAHPKTQDHQGGRKALKELRVDNTRMILTANKGVAMVVMDRKEYIRKAEELLTQTTYRTILSDATIKQKNKLISPLKNIKAKGGTNYTKYKRMSPQGQDPPNLWVTLDSQGRSTTKTHSF